jgi:hypothetical protein
MQGMVRRIAKAGLCVVALMMFGSSPALAKATVRCTGFEGWAYNFEGGIVPPGQGGWIRDAINGGIVDLVLETDGSGSFDIVIRDTTGRTTSQKALGAQMKAVGASTEYGTLIVVSENPNGIVENFLFKLNELGHGSVVWGSIRPHIIVKSSLMVGQCRTM